MPDGLLDDFVVRAALAGVAVALAAGPLGCFVIWRRMAYFGDATAHAAILGVALSLAFEISVFAGVALTSIAMAVAIASLSGRTLAADTLLGVAAHGALAVGVVALSLSGATGIDLEAYLFGDILSVSITDVGVTWAGTVLVLALLASRWSSLVTSTLSADLAQASGVDPARERLVLTVSIAIVVAVALKIVGALLVTALLIIPAAAARPLSRSPESMALAAALIGITAVGGGLGLSLQADTPAGPSIVCVALLAFIATHLFSRIAIARLPFLMIMVALAFLTTLFAGLVTFLPDTVRLRG